MKILTLAASWCTGQSNSCDTLCDDDASTNDCDYVSFTPTQTSTITI